MNTHIDFPEEDSPDLTPGEVASSLPALTPEDMVTVLQTRTCSTCRGAIQVTRHELRRQAPHLYARVLFVCQDGHQGSVTFRASFLGTVLGTPSLGGV